MFLGAAFIGDDTLWSTEEMKVINYQEVGMRSPRVAS